MALVTSQFYNLKDSMSLMTEKPHGHKHSFAHTEQERSVWFHKKTFHKWLSLCIGDKSRRVRKHLCRGPDCELHLWNLQLAWWQSSAAVLLLCFTLAPQLQPGQVHGCYLNDVLILVKQFCVWLNRGSVSQESQY